MIQLQEQKGLALADILIPVVIIVILAAFVYNVAIPAYLGMCDRGRDGAVTRTWGSSSNGTKTYAKNNINNLRSISVNYSEIYL